MSTEDRVKEILSILLDDTIDENTSMESSKNWDSMKHIEMISTLEEELNISFPIEDIPKLTSYKLLLNKIKEII